MKVTRLNMNEIKLTNRNKTAIMNDLFLLSMKLENESITKNTINRIERTRIIVLLNAAMSVFPIKVATRIAPIGAITPSRPKITVRAPRPAVFNKTPE